MRAEHILEVLMDDKKYKAKVEELQKQEQKLSQVLTIAATIEQAEKIARDVTVTLAQLQVQKTEQEAAHKRRMQELEEKVASRIAQLDAKATKDREQYADMYKREAATAVKMEDAKKAIAEAGQMQKQYNDLVGAVQAQAEALRAKVTKINEALNG